jgi:hypothetical protein
LASPPPSHRLLSPLQSALQIEATATRARQEEAPWVDAADSGRRGTTAAAVGGRRQPQASWRREAAQWGSSDGRRASRRRRTGRPPWRVRGGAAGVGPGGGRRRRQWSPAGGFLSSPRGGWRCKEGRQSAGARRAGAALAYAPSFSACSRLRHTSELMLPLSVSCRLYMVVCLCCCRCGLLPDVCVLLQDEGHGSVFC